MLSKVVLDCLNSELFVFFVDKTNDWKMNCTISLTIGIIFAKDFYEGC